MDPKRKKIFFARGWQLRYIGLVSGSLFVMMVFAGLHAIYVAQNNLSPEVFQTFQPSLTSSTIRLFAVGIMYVGVVTIAAVFLSHRYVGPTQRLIEEIKRQSNETSAIKEIHVREGDELEELVQAINGYFNKGKTN